MDATPTLAVIGGSGVHVEDLLTDLRPQTVTTDHGTVEVLVGALDERPVAFLPRHGPGHVVPPHRIDYRANIAALAKIGVERIVATAAVGAIDPDLEPGTLVVVDQFVDFTWGRPQTFFEGGDAGVAHVDVTDPYCPVIRATMADVGAGLPTTMRDGATYVCTQGPRFETAGEIAAFAQLGGDVVGMTGVPEVVLARELGLCYGTVASVTNAAAGLTGDRLTHDEVLDVQEANTRHLRALLLGTLRGLPMERQCSCHVRPRPLSGDR